MENLILIFFFLIPSLIQILGYYFSVHFNQNKIRWFVFIFSMIIYYGLTYHIYQSILEKNYKCGNWIFAIIVLLVIGLTIPLTQIIISAYKYYNKRE